MLHYTNNPAEKKIEQVSQSNFILIGLAGISGNNKHAVEAESVKRKPLVLP
jgi:hypothetical protein